MPNKRSDISPVLRWITGFEVLVLIGSGGGLFFLPSTLSDIWPWELLPFNTRFLGAVYIASLVTAAFLAVMGTWSPARIITPMILGFTAIVLANSIVYLDRFDGPGFSIFGWFLLYTVIPINAAYHVWLYRNRPVDSQIELPTTVRTILGAIAIGSGIYGLGLLVIPDTFSEIWAWPIDEFHARMYSVAFLAPCIGLFFVYLSRTPAEMLSLGLTLIAGGILPILGLVSVDRSVNGVDWSAIETWLWIGLFTVFAVAGMMMLYFSRQEVSKFADVARID